MSTLVMFARFAGAATSSSMPWRITQSLARGSSGLGRGEGRVARGEVDREDGVEREGELDDAEEQDEEQGEDHGEFDQRLTGRPILAGRAAARERHARFTSAGTEAVSTEVVVVSVGVPWQAATATIARRAIASTRSPDTGVRGSDKMIHRER